MGKNLALGLLVVTSVVFAGLWLAKPSVIVQQPPLGSGSVGSEQFSPVRFYEVVSANLVEAGADNSLLAVKTNHSTLTPEEFCDETLIRAAASSGAMTFTLPNLASTTSEPRGCLLYDGAVRNLVFFGSGTTSSIVTIATGTGWTTLQPSASSTPYTFGQGGGGVLKAVRTSATAGLLFWEQWAAR